MIGLSDLWLPIAIAFVGGIAGWLFKQLHWETEAKWLQGIVSVLLAVIFIRYAILLYRDMQTFARF